MSAAARVGVDTILCNILHKCQTTPLISIDLLTSESLNEKVTINGSFAAVAGDSIETHTIESSGSCVPHVTPPLSPTGIQKIINAGSAKVTIGGIPAARVGDQADDDGAVGTGSPNVTIG